MGVSNINILNGQYSKCLVSREVVKMTADTPVVQRCCQNKQWWFIRWTAQGWLAPKSSLSFTPNWCTPFATVVYPSKLSIYDTSANRIWQHADISAMHLYRSNIGQSTAVARMTMRVQRAEYTEAIRVDAMSTRPVVTNVCCWNVQSMENDR